MQSHFLSYPVLLTALYPHLVCPSVLVILTRFRLVLETLEPLSGDRKCFRMINGVLTERTVKEVVPILKTNSDGLKKTLEELVKQYKLKQDDMEKWKVC
jgi:chaperonin cofactor prefoldin